MVEIDLILCYFHNDIDICSINGLPFVEQRLLGHLLHNFTPMLLSYFKITHSYKCLKIRDRPNIYIF